MGKTIELYGFPSFVIVSQVKTFVEQYTGEGTVFAIKIRQGKGKVPRAYAIIQFTSAKDAASMMSLATRATTKLWFGSSFLKAREMVRDIVPKPRTFLHGLNDVKLYFGCQISKGRFSVLWSKMDVSVNFGIGMRKLHFFLSHINVEYKLELSYENIWKIQLHRPRGETANYLLIQVVRFKFFILIFKYTFHFLSKLYSILWWKKCY